MYKNANTQLWSEQTEIVCNHRSRLEAAFNVTCCLADWCHIEQIFVHAYCHIGHIDAFSVLSKYPLDIILLILFRGSHFSIRQGFFHTTFKKCRQMNLLFLESVKKLVIWRRWRDDLDGDNWKSEGEVFRGSPSQKSREKKTLKLQMTKL